MQLFIYYPSWIKPEIIPGLPVRWYGLMYLIAFLIGYILFKKQVTEKKLELSDDDISNLFFWIILGILIGGRVFSTLVYDTSGKYWLNPLLIFWPFDSDFHFTGLQGMSYHGGLIGGAASMIIYCRKKRLNTAVIGDMLAVSIPLGYTFGRLGNFINGELYGRVTAARWGMIFPYAKKFSSSSDWVIGIAEKTGIDLAAAGNYVNLPRHPSQLYEAFFEGIFLWAVLWFFLRKRKHAPGEMIGTYILGYGTVRFFIEYFREPDADIGFIIELSGKDNPIHTLNSFFNFSMGQLLCFLMAAAGIIIIYIFRKYEKTKTENNNRFKQVKRRKKKRF